MPNAMLIPMMFMIRRVGLPSRILTVLSFERLRMDLAGIGVQLMYVYVVAMNSRERWVSIVISPWYRRIRQLSR